MMGVYIKCMEIPETCRDCFLFGKCRHGDKLLQCRSDKCPIVEVRTPHGRLIDAEAYENYLDEMWIPANIDAIYAMPTIIEKEDK